MKRYLTGNANVVVLGKRGTDDLTKSDYRNLAAEFVEREFRERINRVFTALNIQRYEFITLTVPEVVTPIDEISEIISDYRVFEIPGLLDANPAVHGGFRLRVSAESLELEIIYSPQQELFGSITTGSTIVLILTLVAIPTATATMGNLISSRIEGATTTEIRDERGAFNCTLSVHFRTLSSYDMSDEAVSEIMLASTHTPAQKEIALKARESCLRVTGDLPPSILNPTEDQIDIAAEVFAKRHDVNFSWESAPFVRFLVEQAMIAELEEHT